MTIRDTLSPSDDPGVDSEAGMATAPAELFLAPVPIPLVNNSAIKPTSHRILVPDENALVRLLDDLLNGAGLSVKQAAKNMGVSDEAIRQYIRGRRSNPSVMWFIKFANLCGCEVIVRRKRQ